MPEQNMQTRAEPATRFQENCVRRDFWLGAVEVESSVFRF